MKISDFWILGREILQDYGERLILEVSFEKEFLVLVARTSNI